MTVAFNKKFGDFSRFGFAYKNVVDGKSAVFTDIYIENGPFFNRAAFLEKFSDFGKAFSFDIRKETKPSGIDSDYRLIVNYCVFCSISK